MRRTSVAVLAAAGLAGVGCGDYAGPSNSVAAWSLVRVGAAHLPAQIGGGTPILVLLADTLFLDPGRIRDAQAILTHVSVSKLGDGQPLHVETRHSYAVSRDTLTFDSCPIDVYCAAASFVYAPLSFHIVGDSLFQVVSATGPILGPQPYVYARVRQ